MLQMENTRSDNVREISYEIIKDARSGGGRGGSAGFNVPGAAASGRSLLDGGGAFTTTTNPMRSDSVFTPASKPISPLSSFDSLIAHESSKLAK